MNQSRWERLSAIYHAARDQPADARHAFLDRACSGDSELRSEIESLLRHNLPSVPAFTVLAGGANVPSDHPVAPGTHIGTYRIERALGAGGMGEVHLATDTRLNRPVALKFVSVAADPDTRRRFQQETRAVSSLNHPHILTVHDSGQFAGREYLVTEFVDGGTLKTWLEAAPRTWRQTIELLIGVADALAAAHDAGILHRDVKPANILVAQNGYAKLADFGLAKLAGASDQETRSEPRTGAGVVVGTLDYMSPEQLSGGQIDRRSDVFSFGVVLYQALSGRRPFAGKTNLHVVEGILHQTPAPLSQDIPAPLREIVAKTLEKDPADRYQSMRDLVVDLRRLVRHTTELPAAVPSRRRGFLSIAAALVAIAVVAAVIATASWWRTSVSSDLARAPIRSILVLPFENLSGDPNEEYLADGLVDDVITRLKEIRALRVIALASSMQLKGNTKPLSEIAREHDLDAFMGGSWRRADGLVRVTVTLMDASGAVLWTRPFNRDFGNILSLQASIAEAAIRDVRVQIRPEEAERLAAVREVQPAAYEANAFGRHHLDRGEEEGFVKAIEYFEQAITLQKDYADAYTGLSWALSSKANPDLPRAEEAARAAIALDKDSANAYAALGGARFAAWDWDGATDAFEKALELNPSALDCGCYAYVLSARGKSQRALQVSKAALEANPLAIDPILEHGFVLLYNMGQPAEAEPYFSKVLELQPRNATAAVHLVTTYVMLKQWDKAIKAADRDEFRDGAVMGRVYAFAGHRDQARAILNKLRQTPRTNANVGFIDFGIAAIELPLGNIDRGLEALSRAADRRVPFMRWLKVDPHFNDIRGDPRFQKIIDRLGIPD
jgi:eukaryotic-like serine/threonine-protein kinase